MKRIDYNWETKECIVKMSLMEFDSICRLCAVEQDQQDQPFDYLKAVYAIQRIVGCLDALVHFSQKLRDKIEIGETNVNFEA